METNMQKLLVAFALSLALSPLASAAPSDAELVSFFERPEHGLARAFKAHFSDPAGRRGFFDLMAAADDAATLGAELGRRGVALDASETKAAMEEAKRLAAVKTAPVSAPANVGPALPPDALANVSRLGDLDAGRLFDGVGQVGIAAFVSGGPEKGGVNAGMGGLGGFLEVPLELKGGKGSLALQAGLSVHSDVLKTDAGAGTSGGDTLWQSADGKQRTMTEVHTRMPSRTFIEFLGAGYQTPPLFGHLVLEAGARLGWGQAPVSAEIERETYGESYVTETYTKTPGRTDCWTTSTGRFKCEETPPVMGTRSKWVKTGSRTETLQSGSKKSAWFLSQYAALRCVEMFEDIDARVEAFRVPGPGPEQLGLRVGVVFKP